MRDFSAEIVAIGSYAPPDILTNEDFERMVDTSEEWILQRTGIEERRIAPSSWGSSDLMAKAVEICLKNGELTIDDIDLIITSSSFGDRGFNVPRTCDILKSKIRARQRVLSVEENAECAGFGFALGRAVMEINDNGYQRVLVVSGDKTTSATNYKDRHTCILFGDAAGAVVLERTNRKSFGILAYERGTDVRYLDCMEVTAGGSALPLEQAISKEVFPDPNFGIIDKELFYMRMPGGNKMLKVIGGTIGPELCRLISQKAGVPLENFRHIIPHQANIRINEMIEERLNLPGVVHKETIKLYGNTSGSSVPLSLDNLYRAGKLDTGDYIILEPFGAGFTYAAVAIRWSLPKFTGAE